MGILDELSESKIHKIIYHGDYAMVDGYGYIRFHNLIGLMSYENPSKTLEMLKKVNSVALNSIDDVSEQSLLFYVDNLEILEYLVSRLLENTICCIDEEGETVLIHTIHGENVEKAKFFLNYLPDQIIEKLLYDGLDLRIMRGGLNTLHYAVYHNMKSVCELLIGKIKQKDLDNKTMKGETVLHFAIRSGYTDITMLLIDKMTTKGLEAKNMYNETALHLAITKHNIDICKLLIPKMSIKALKCCPDYSKRNSYMHAEMEDLLDIRDLISSRDRIANFIKYPEKYPEKY